MNWLLPTPLLFAAGAVALLILALLLRWPHSHQLHMAATIIITLAVPVAMMLVWQVLWWVAQRW